MPRILKRAVVLLVTGLFMLCVQLRTDWIHAESQLVQNPGFELGDGLSPELWEADLWSQAEGASSFGVTQDDAHSGAWSAWIESSQPDHAKWVQSIPVEPSTNYLITAWVKVLSMGEGEIGANVFPLGVGGVFPQINEVAPEWQRVQFYGATGPGQREFKIAAAIGGYGKLNTGKALFDDVTAVKVDQLPEGMIALPLGTEKQNNGNGDPGSEAIGNVPDVVGGGAGGVGSSNSTVEKHVPILPVLLWSALFCILFAWLYQRMISQKHPLDQRSNSYSGWMGVALVIGLLLRIWMGLTVRGFETDMNTFMSWAHHANEQGLVGFYSEGIFVDYPPGYIYILYILGVVQGWLGLDYGTSATMLLFKLPSILADIVAAYIVYRAGSSRFGTKLGWALSVMYLFNPAVLINSAGWGQADSFYVLFLISSLTALSSRRLEKSAVWFAIAALIKPQTFIFTPVWLLAFLYYRSWRRVIASVLLGGFTFVLLALPFFWNNGGLPALMDLYRTTLASYPYATVNAFNLYALFGYNWAPLGDRWLLLSFRTWGMLFIFAAVAYAVYIYLRKRGRDLTKSYFIALALIVIVFVLGTKMHERYMFPALLLSLFSFIHSRDRRLLYLYLGFSLTQYINVAYVLGHLNLGMSPDNDGIVLLCSLANVGLLIYMLILGYRIYVQKRRLPIKPQTESGREASDALLLQQLAGKGKGKGRSLYKIRFQSKDWLVISLVTVLYTGLALYQLGAGEAPATVWKPSKPTSFYADFGEDKAVDRVNYFGGASTGEFKIQFGSTPSQWEKTINIPHDTGAVLAWRSEPVDTVARYVRVTVEQPGIALHEMAFYETGQNGHNPQPISIVGIYEETGGGTASGRSALLFDEASTSAYQPDFFNSTYFDEIYHARTAYEYWHHLPPYETTHPPLGKLLIGLGMQLFGLNPFGWRIMGTLFGAAMLPLIYRFALQLFGQRKFAVMTMVLLVVEFMHFAQTRIATIDVYAVFFILLMFYSMNRYFNMSFHKQPLGKTLFPLFWAGLFFGIGISTKWIVLYGGAGLAIMLFLSLYARYKEYAAAKRSLRAAANGAGTEYLDHSDHLAHPDHPDHPANKELYRRIEQGFWRNALITLGACCIFFVLIPVTIYTLCYIPALAATEGGFHFGSLIQAQKDMFDYHSRLVGSHPFASAWWEWPLMKRPVWFYSAQGEAGGLAAGMVQSIVTIGNPLIWWTGIVAMAAAFWLTLKRGDSGRYVIWIAFLAQYVPWMLVTRETFLYHYFAMVPFVIVAIVYVSSIAEEKWLRFRYVRYVFLSAAVVLFAMFYPVLSGMEVHSGYVEHVLRWFPSWIF
ncbi:phospholipid carrier-dependent glycosyltransferase [Paenibacillus lentus]|uniref:Polyprenol-phosphate-mannose--protein mannosyltransferase n=1 Tax=Paenibacillus lentus TaxID=1338368 RepID=A0A3S8S0M9_9BACL|nr:phospholipid carrier-dependent glycosyltransferase [Paenibacillus lentus]AZK48773.1 phospholipid carrier-dependent glycosyltransferase [Paenibacillus lentus]